VGKKKAADRRSFLKKSAVGIVGAGLWQEPDGIIPNHNSDPQVDEYGSSDLNPDIVLKNGTVIDGCGNPWFKADMALKNGRIVHIGKIDSNAEKIIDAQGLIVAPGIIDLHNHSDTEILLNQKAESAVRQGITTMIVGNCGGSAAPQIQKTRNADWLTYREYLSKVESHGTSVNFGGFVGHGSVRRIVMGMEARHSTAPEVERMRRLIEESLEGGAFGLSTGLEYAPGANAATEELIELTKVLSDYPGAVYATHMRQRDEKAVEAVQEGIEIGVKAGVPVHFSHHPMRYPFHGRMNELLKLKEEAREGGADVTFDTMILNYNMSNMGALLPHWMHEGGSKRLVERLKDPEIRRQVKEYQNPQQKHFRDGLWDKVSNTFTDEDIITCLQHPLSMAVGSDVTAHAPYGPMSERLPHPAAYGYYPMFFRKFVREMNVLSLEDAVRKVSSFPAQRIGLWNRGILREGTQGDIMVFDISRIREKSTFKQPHQYPEGVEYVLVNGQLVIDRGKHTGALPGNVLRSSSVRL